MCARLFLFLLSPRFSGVIYAPLALAGARRPGLRCERAINLHGRATGRLALFDFSSRAKSNSASNSEAQNQAKSNLSKSFAFCSAFCSSASSERASRRLKASPVWMLAQTGSQSRPSLFVIYVRRARSSQRPAGSGACCKRSNNNDNNKQPEQATDERRRGRREAS